MEYRALGVIKASLEWIYLRRSSLSGIEIKDYRIRFDIRTKNQSIKWMWECNEIKSGIFLLTFSLFLFFFL